MKILVTGGAGFIGSNVVDGYIDAGHEVVVIDNLSSGKVENLNAKAKFYEVDIRSEEIGAIFEEEKFDIVNHHAAQMSVPDSVKDPLFDADVNVKGLLNILECAVKSNVKKIIFISSGGAVYGDGVDVPTKETEQPKPFSPYAITKYTGEKYLYYYHRHYGLDYTALRYANIYGPRQIPHGEAGVVAIFMDNIIEGIQSKLYFYEEEPRGMTRDYTFVGDIVKANILALEKGSGGIFNIGTAVETHTKDLYDAIVKAFEDSGESIGDELKELILSGVREGDLKRSAIDASLAKQELGWVDSFSLKDGIMETLKWRLNLK